MEHLPAYIQITFILTTLLTLLLLYRATHFKKAIIAGALVWLALQAIIGLSGFYMVTTGTPPRFALLLLPPVIFIIILFLTKKGKEAIDSFNVKTLTLLHIVRIPVELTLYWLFLQKALPEVMTFEGRNFDMLCGLTAPFIYYFGYVRNTIHRKVLIAWNIMCLLLLANIVITAVTSAPFGLQKPGSEGPDFALFYFPFIWLPCFVVPAVLLAHLVSLRRLVKAN